MTLNGRCSFFPAPGGPATEPWWLGRRGADSISAFVPSPIVLRVPCSSVSSSVLRALPAPTCLLQIILPGQTEPLEFIFFFLFLSPWLSRVIGSCEGPALTRCRASLGGAVERLPL